MEFFETDAGRSPVREFLDELKATDPGDFAALLPGLAKLRQRQDHRAPLSKARDGGRHELRHAGKLNPCVLWFFRLGRRIVAVQGIRNNAQAIPARNLDTARDRMRDWRERHA